MEWVQLNYHCQEPLLTRFPYFALNLRGKEQLLAHPTYSSMVLPMLFWLQWEEGLQQYFQYAVAGDGVGSIQELLAQRFVPVFGSVYPMCSVSAECRSYVEKIMDSGLKAKYIL
jgi:hypothetical protein